MDRITARIAARPGEAGTAVRPASDRERERDPREFERTLTAAPSGPPQKDGTAEDQACARELDVGAAADGEPGARLDLTG